MAELRGLPDGRVFFLGDDGLWHHVPDPQTFDAYGFGWGDIQWVDGDDQVQPEGEEIGSVGQPPPAGDGGGGGGGEQTGQLVGLPDGRVFRFDGSSWRHVPDGDTFAALGLDWNAVIWLDQLPGPQGSELPSVNGPDDRDAGADLAYETESTYTEYGLYQAYTGDVADGYSAPGWIVATFKVLGWKLTPNAIEALQLWAQSEGMPVSANNPLAATDRYNHSGTWNSSAVQLYRSVGDMAHVYKIKWTSSTYRAIGDALRTGASLSTIYTAINRSPWCAHCQSGHYPVALYQFLYGSTAPPTPTPGTPTPPPVTSPPPQPSTGGSGDPPPVPDTPDPPAAPSGVLAGWRSLTHALAVDVANDAQDALTTSGSFLDAVS